MANHEVIQYWKNPEEVGEAVLLNQKEMVLEIRTKGTEAE
jgi:hypothetical protein